MPTDPFTIAKLYRYLRVVDVCDALDGIGYFNLTLMSPEVRPLYLGMRFWGPALTVRCVPANRPMWKLSTTREIVDAHRIWFAEVGDTDIHGLIEPGHVVVMESGGGPEVGFWGSNNSLAAINRGAAGVITDGDVRDTAELARQRTPVCCRRRGRTIIPGRIRVVETQGTIACGGVQVRPGDIVGADDDGVVVVPLEVAAEVAVHARAVLLADMRGRRRLYEQQGLPLDETVDFDTVEAYYQSLPPLPPGEGRGEGSQH